METPPAAWIAAWTAASLEEQCALACPDLACVWPHFWKQTLSTLFSDAFVSNMLLAVFNSRAVPKLNALQPQIWHCFGRAETDTGIGRGSHGSDKTFVCTLVGATRSLTHCLGDNVDKQIYQIYMENVMQYVALALDPSAPDPYLNIRINACSC